MKLIKCDKNHITMVRDFYHKVVKYLETHTNYPLWDSDRPSDFGILQAVEHGEMYICTNEESDILGAVVLSEDPEGNYGAGDWSRKLNRGEYLCVHLLAVNPDYLKNGVGKFIIDESIKNARSGRYKALRLDLVPGNTPAERLYKKSGFVYVGTKDLRRNKVNIPVFDLYELNFE